MALQIHCLDPGTLGHLFGRAYSAYWAHGASAPCCCQSHGRGCSAEPGEGLPARADVQGLCSAWKGHFLLLRQLVLAMSSGKLSEITLFGVNKHIFGYQSDALRSFSLLSDTCWIIFLCSPCQEWGLTPSPFTPKAQLLETRLTSTFPIDCILKKLLIS